MGEKYGSSVIKKQNFLQSVYNQIYSLQIKKKNLRKIFNLYKNMKIFSMCYSTFYSIKEVISSI